MPEKASETLVVGKISGVYGVKGWVKVYSWTQPRENIFSYQHWLLGDANASVQVDVVDGKVQGKGMIASLDGCDTRDQAESLVGKEIRILASDLPPAEKGEYYWRDLIGLTVRNLQDQELGVVKRLFETGANDVLVVKGKREHLVPWVQGQFIKKIDLEAGVMLVDWDEDF